MARLRAHDWDKYQNYKNRRPPWIKLHSDILNNPKIMMLADASIGLLMLSWMLCSQSDVSGEFELDFTKLSFKLHRTITMESFKPLIDIGLLEYIPSDASECLQALAKTTEERRGEESNTRGETEERRRSRDVVKKKIDDRLTDLKERWNSMATEHGLPKMADYGTKRLTVAKERVADDYWWDRLDAAMEAIPMSPFLTGSNERGWKANIDWLLRPDSTLKLVEGQYANNGHDEEDEEESPNTKLWREAKEKGLI